MVARCRGLTALLPRAAAVVTAITLSLGGVLSCGPVFFAAALIDDAVEDYKDRKPPPYRCPNNLCERDRGETCRTCPKDCGACAHAPPQLISLTPTSGRAYRWVTIFGTHLQDIERVWLAHDGKLTPIRHKRVGAQLLVFIPHASPGGTLHVESLGKRSPSQLSYTVTPPSRDTPTPAPPGKRTRPSAPAPPPGS